MAELLRGYSLHSARFLIIIPRCLLPIRKRVHGSGSRSYCLSCRAVLNHHAARVYIIIQRCYSQSCRGVIVYHAGGSALSFRGVIVYHAAGCCYSQSCRRSTSSCRGSTSSCRRFSVPEIIFFCHKLNN